MNNEIIEIENDSNVSAPIKLSNSLCRGIWKPTPLNIYERRILMLLISRIQPDDEKFKEYEIKFTEILTNRGGDNYKIMRETVSSLIHRSVTMKEGEDILDFPIFYLIRTKENKIKVAIHDRLAPYLLQLKSFYTKFDLEEFFNLSSTYSQALFLFLKSWENCKETFLEIDALYDMLGIPNEHRNNYADFKRKTLEPILKKLAMKTSLAFVSDAIKEKNKVVRVRFINQNYQKKISLGHKKERTEEVSFEELLQEVEDEKLRTKIYDTHVKDKSKDYKKYGSWANQQKKENNIDYDSYLARKTEK